MADNPPEGPAPPGPKAGRKGAERFARQAAALRENLRKRKAQKRARRLSALREAPPGG